MNHPVFTPHLVRLDNGLRLVTVEMPHLHSASISAYVRVGSRFESAADNGLSHFLEHMLFRGTTRLPDAYSINRAVEELGGTLYAETRRDSSLYHIGLHPEMVPMALPLLAEILRDPVFSQLEVERRIILEEMQEDLDHKGRDINLSDLIYDLAFPEHPLGQKITGPIGNVERFDDADLRRHFQAFYGAQNIVLCVCGAVAEAAVREWAAPAWGLLPPGQDHAPVPPRAMDRGPLRVHRDGDMGTQTTLCLAFRAPGELDPDYAALLVLGRVLDDGMSTRLYQRIVNELGLAYYVSAGLDSFADAGVFELEANAVHEKVPRLLEEMFGLLSGLSGHAVDATELAKAKRRFRWDLLSACDEPGSMSDWWGRTELYRRPDGLAAKLARIEAVGLADVQRVARRIFTPDNLTVGTVGRMGSRIKAYVREAMDRYAS